MGLLDKLWDDTIGGPQPTKGVGKLRKLDVPLSPRSTLARADSSPYSEAGDDDSRRSSLESRRSMDYGGTPPPMPMPMPGNKRVSQSISIGGSPRAGIDRSSSLPSSPYGGPSSPSAASYSPSSVRERENVWRSVFHPGSNKTGMDRLGSSKFDSVAHAKDKSPTVYDWYNRIDV